MIQKNLYWHWRFKRIKHTPFHFTTKFSESNCTQGISKVYRLSIYVERISSSITRVVPVSIHSTECISHSVECISHSAECISHSAECISHASNKDLIFTYLNEKGVPTFYTEFIVKLESHLYNTCFVFWRALINYLLCYPGSLRW